MNHDNHINDTLEVLAAGSTGMAVLLTDTELILKCLVAAATLGFIIYKWYKESKRK